MDKIVKSFVGECGGKAASHIVDDLYEEYIKPKLEKIKNRPKDSEIIFDNLREYLKKAYDRNRYMNTIVFNKETKTVDDLYIPLTIIKNSRNNRKKIIIDENMENFFESLHKILIIDTAGMGKSTLAKYVYLKCLEKDYGIPFLIEMRKLEKGTGILQYISDELCLGQKELSCHDIRSIIERGEFIFFFDGYDEIPKENKDEITKEVRRFIEEFSQNNFMLTSRDDESINMFTDFEKYHIRPLEKKEAYELIRKYDENGIIAEKLIEEIESNEQYEVLEEFLENPLMVSLLYSSYHYKGIIQYKKHLFYRQVYDALYEGHDITKGSGLIHTKKSKLDIEDFNRLLSVLGYLSIKENKISFYREDILKLIEQSCNIICQETNCLNFLDDLLHSVPIFVKEGIEYKWSHKSFAEYYAAYFICFIEKEREKQIITSIMKSNNNTNYHNVLDFCYDMDPKIAKEVIVYNLITDYVEYCNDYKLEVEDKELILQRYYDFIDKIRFVKTETNIESKRNKGGSLDADALFEAIDKIKTITDDDIGYFDIASKNYNIFMFVSRKPEYEVVRLLDQKGIDIFEEIKEKEYTMKFWNELDAGAYVWGETDNSIFKNNSKAILSYIHHRNITIKNKILDYDKCLCLKRKIEKEITKQLDDIYSF